MSVTDFGRQNSDEDQNFADYLEEVAKDEGIPAAPLLASHLPNYKKESAS